MAKVGTRRVDDRTAELDEKLTNNMVAAMWCGVSLMISLVTLTAMGGTGLYFGRAHGGPQGAKLGLLLGLMVGVIILGMLLRLNADRIRARSENLYRGLWGGMIFAAVLLAVMAFAPELLGATPPPGQDPTQR